MKIEQDKDKTLSIYQTAICAAEEILKKIDAADWNEKIMLKSDHFFEDEKYERVLLDRMDFFTSAENISDTAGKLEEILSLKGEQEEDGAGQDKIEIEVLFCGNAEEGKSAKIFLEIRRAPYRIPFEVDLIPFPAHEIFLQRKTRTDFCTQETFSYYLFPPQDFLPIALYEILKELELIRDLSWYQGVYEVITKEPVDGRKIWESLNRLIKEYPIPSLEKRMDTLKGYENYGYMKKRWKERCKREKERCPRWEDVIALLGTFLAPIFENIIKDEVFFGDWMPELGRYL